MKWQAQEYDTFDVHSFLLYMMFSTTMFTHLFLSRLHATPSIPLRLEMRILILEKDIDFLQGLEACISILEGACRYTYAIGGISGYPI
jgi:hypothetical protein